MEGGKYKTAREVIFGDIVVKELIKETNFNSRQATNFKQNVF